LDGAIEALRRNKVGIALRHIRRFRRAASPTTHPDLIEAGRLLMIACDLVAQEHFELASGPLCRAALIEIRHSLQSRGWRLVNGLPRLVHGPDGPAA
jgi:hypothetical protein